MSETAIQAIGTIGVICFALGWIPQTVETVRAGRCAMNAVFLILYAMGSAALTAYSALRHDPVFLILNALATVGALVNAYYWKFPRDAGPASPSPR